MSNRPDFYKELPSFSNFTQFVDSSSYQKVPSDWWVVITDVKGSTAAISEGRYKEVNLMGAASIVAIVNTIGSHSVPFVFGGDGATILVPDEHLRVVEEALVTTREVAKQRYQLDLRVGAVNIKEIEAAGGEVFCGKHEVQPGNFLAVLKGSGLSIAERWIKGRGTNGKSYEFTLSKKKVDRALANKVHSGLSCRWVPHKSQNGKVVSVVISANGSPDEKAKIYAELNRKLSYVFGNFSSGDNLPVNPKKLKPYSLFDSATKETKLAFPHGGFRYWISWKLAVLEILAVRALFALNIKIGRFIPSEYIKEISRNTDFQKFDDTLKMVLDCSQDQVENLTGLLEDLHAKGQICFGMHLSDQALMTCFVESTSDNQHIHFVDGDDGGYAKAAIQLKEQLKSQSS